MAKCPKCRLDVRTPWFFDLQGWAELRCPHCLAQLQMKPRPIVPIFVPAFIVLPLLSRYGHRLALASEILLGITTIALILMLTVRVPVALRKTTPLEPAIRLNIEGK